MIAANTRLAAMAAMSLFAATCLFACGTQSESDKSISAITSIDRNLTQEAWLWNTGTDCSGCHNVESMSQPGQEQHLSHGEETTCFTCHDDFGALKDVHNANMDTKRSPIELKTTDVENNACTQCHDLQIVIANTPENAILIDVSGTVTNPHTTLETLDHAGILCIDCHDIHQNMNTKEVAENVCQRCHHANVFECGTCHE